VISSKAFLFILDENLNLLAASQTTDHAIRWHDALEFKDNRLVGISGLRESKFRETFSMAAQAQKRFFSAHPIMGTRKVDFS